MPRKPPGPEHEGGEFRRSPAYADFTAALRTAGCRSYVELIARPMAEQRAFHEDWSQRMRVRAGMAPPVADRVLSYQEARRTAKAETTAQVATLHAEGYTDRDIAGALELGKSYVARLRADAGLDPNGPGARNRALRPKVAEGVRRGMTDREIAAECGVNANIVGHLRRDLKLRRTGWGGLDPITAERQREALRLREEDGLEFTAIAARLDVAPSTAFRWTRNARARQWWADRAAA